MSATRLTVVARRVTANLKEAKANCWPDEQEADEAAQRGEVAKISKAHYLHGTL